MNNKIQITVTLSVDTLAPVVVIDGPNVYYDNYCKKHKMRQCSKCQNEMIDLGLTIRKNKRTYADTKNREWFVRSLEITSALGITSQKPLLLLSSLSI